MGHNFSEAGFLKFMANNAFRIIYKNPVQKPARRTQHPYFHMGGRNFNVFILTIDEGSLFEVRRFRQPSRQPFRKKIQRET